MKFPANYNYIVPDDHRALVYYASADNDSVLAVETVNHRAIVLANTPEEVLEVAKQFSDDSYTAGVTTWHTLSVDWRMAIYNGELVLIKGGLTWQATGLTEAPAHDASLVCDPYTWAYVVKVGDAYVERDGGVVIGATPADLMVQLEGFDVGSLAEVGNDVVAIPLLQLANSQVTAMYRGQLHDVAQVMMRNTAFLMDLVKNTSPADAVDPEQNIINKLEETE
jgi:hypothetical protein